MRLSPSELQWGECATEAEGGIKKPHHHLFLFALLQALLKISAYLLVFFLLQNVLFQKQLEKFCFSPLTSILLIL